MEIFDALIDLLLTVGYIDGRLHADEQAFIKQYMSRLVDHVPAERLEAAYLALHDEIAALASEVVAASDDHYVQTRLKVRAVASFRAFSPENQAVALELLGALMLADGTVTPNEQALHDELLGYFQTPPSPVVAPPPGPPEMLQILDPGPRELTGLAHPLLDPLEQGYAADPAARLAQAHADYNLIFAAIGTWERARARGNGRLAGVTDIAQLAPGTRLLDGHVHVLRPDRPTELIVLGDLHGCYACLKAALLQSDFVERARRHQQDPNNHPDVKLVLLGDYIDRGRFGFEGVVRAALQLLTTLPDHVILLRGNHEFLVRHEGRIVSAVQPAEAVPGIEDRVPPEVLEAYRHLFEHMPTSLLFERTLFVHGGVPRDETFAAVYRDLSSLDDYVMRFEMMWSDPVDTDVVPPELQRESPRFNFGRDQFRAFMERIGCHAMVRGHEQVNTGLRMDFDLGDRRLYTLFSAGGHDNEDLPPDSRYRAVTPMAISVRWEGGQVSAQPWPLRYQPFMTAEHNGLYR